jgi:hypothetical protein
MWCQEILPEGRACSLLRLWELEQMELSVLTDLINSETSGRKGKKKEQLTVDGLLAYVY